MNVAIIPARIGSQRILKKNIKKFYGKPIISYPIQIANESKNIEKVIVSTDSEEIKKIAIDSGAIVPFLRPKNLSDGVTPTKPVISHAVNFLIKNGWSLNNVCCIYPCSPLLLSEHLDFVYNRLINSDESFAYPVLKYSHPIQRALIKDTNNKVRFLNPQNELKRTQDFKETFHDAGQFYWGKKDAWISNKNMHSDSIGIEFDTMTFIDIDNEEDWNRAKALKSLNE
jgi:pseudaminic acid cytidylyltransferase